MQYNTIKYIYCLKYFEIIININYIKIKFIYFIFPFKNIIFILFLNSLFIYMIPSNINNLTIFIKVNNLINL